VRIEPAARRYESALEDGRLDRPAYLLRNLERRLDPGVQRPGTRSVVSFGMRYRLRPPPAHPRDGLARGRVAAYALGPDYHQVLRQRIAGVVELLHGAGLLSSGLSTGPGGPPGQHVAVDTAPVLEKAWAQAAGLGWQGKHSNLLSRRHGSWLLLGELLSPDLFEESVAAREHCGRCTRCIDACPTGALTHESPFELNIGRCISYLNLEERGSIPVQLREGMADWLFGCDLCLEVCPFNRFAEVEEDGGSAERVDQAYPPLVPILEASNRELRGRAAGTALSWLAPKLWRRNACVVAGNLLTSEALSVRERRRLVAALRQHAGADANPLVREHARWALSLQSEPTGAMNRPR
jgi:epoxyqueuosine reductase